MNAPFWSYEPTAEDLVELTAVQCLREAQELTRYIRNGILADEVGKHVRTLIEARDELNSLIAKIEASHKEAA